MLELIAKKVGMTHQYKENGVSTPLTMLKFYDNKVISIKEEDNKHIAQIGFEKTENKKNISKSLIGLYEKAQQPIHKKLKTSNLNKKTSVKAGDSFIISDILKLGDKISVRGTSSGKGFAGVMKRWNFRGLEASHGVSVSHRSHGSTGQRQDPGKTFRGKKMAGHLGVDNVTIKNLQIEYIDSENSIIAVRGSVPGRNGSDLLIKLKGI
ncbi:MAG: 50S ribosomal protein L3 [Alphaproteobacteria bacterium]